MTKTIAEKLTVKPDAAVWISDAAQAGRIGPLPAGATLTGDLAEAVVAVVFVEDAASTRRLLDANRAALATPAALWVAYPKANRTDINRDSLWPIVADDGQRPISQVALDEVGSALRFRPLKPGEVFARDGQ